MIIHSLAAVLGFLLDLCFGDPEWLWHPVRAIGKLIGWLDQKLYKERGSDRKNLVRGMLLWTGVMGVTALAGWVVLAVLYRIHPLCGFLGESFISYQLLAAKSLKTESMKVCHALEEHDVEKARKAVSMIVGRDTECLTEEGVTKAAVETVAENTSDGEIAPLFYLMIGGAWLGLLYKAVNTMDSMVGYKNQRYLWFGRTAAKMDDLWNLIPARISAGLMIGTAFFLGMDWRQAARIYSRDRYNHKSPNSAHTEAVCAGALQIQLAGGAFYFGTYVEKPAIGDRRRTVIADDIRQANRLLYGTAWLGLGIFLIFRLAVWYASGI